MIHFDFVVSDTDAENIISIMRNQITRNDQLIMKAIIANDIPLVESYERDSVYVESLIGMMKNTKQ